jgi:hypothetical protein
MLASYLVQWVPWAEHEREAYRIAGRLRVKIEDGAELEFGPQDALIISPGHDAWIVGTEPAMMLDFSGSAQYANQPSTPHRRRVCWAPPHFARAPSRDLKMASTITPSSSPARTITSSAAQARRRERWCAEASAGASRISA